VFFVLILDSFFLYFYFFGANEVALFDCLFCRATGPGDVKFKVLFCGVCHSDLHQIHNDWGGSQYPMVPG